MAGAVAPVHTGVHICDRRKAGGKKRDRARGRKEKKRGIKRAIHPFFLYRFLDLSPVAAGREKGESKKRKEKRKSTLPFLLLFTETPKKEGEEEKKRKSLNWSSNSGRIVPKKEKKYNQRKSGRKKGRLAVYVHTGLWNSIAETESLRQESAMVKRRTKGGGKRKKRKNNVLVPHPAMWRKSRTHDLRHDQKEKEGGKGSAPRLTPLMSLHPQQTAPDKFRKRKERRDRNTNGLLYSCVSTARILCRRGGGGGEGGDL